MSIFDRIFGRTSRRVLLDGQYVGKEAARICKTLKSGTSDKGEQQLLSRLPRENPRLEIVVRRVPHPRLGRSGIKALQVLFFLNGIQHRSRGRYAVPDFHMEFD